MRLLLLTPFLWATDFAQGFESLKIPMGEEGKNYEKDYENKDVGA